MTPLTFGRGTLICNLKYYCLDTRSHKPLKNPHLLEISWVLMAILLLSKVTESSVLKDKALSSGPGETWVSIWVLVIIFVGSSKQSVIFTNRKEGPWLFQTSLQMRRDWHEMESNDTRSEDDLLPGQSGSVGICHKQMRQIHHHSSAAGFSACWMSTTSADEKKQSFCGIEQTPAP